MEKREGVPFQEIEFESPDYLEPDRNFYDQFPFAQAVDDVSSMSGISPEVLRRGLTQLSNAKKFQNFSTEQRFSYVYDETSDIHDYYHAHYGKIAKEVKANTRAEGITSGMIAAGLRQTASLLREYPFWIEYVFLNRDIAQYRYNGDHFQNPQVKKVFPVKGYGKWLHDRLANEQRLQGAAVRVVLNETFTDTHDPNTLVEFQRSTGKGSVWREYKLLKASGFSK